MACITNTEYVAAAKKQAEALLWQAKVDTAIQVGIALWQRNSSKSIANMQNEIADRQLKLAEEIEAHAELYWPEEKELVDDIFGMGKTTTGYVSLAGSFGGMAENSMQQGRKQWIDTMRTRCMAPTPCEDARWQRNAQLARADLIAYAARQDESRTQVLNDRRYAYQYAALQMGRGQLRDLISYQSISGASGAQAASLLTGTVNSALTMFGYYRSEYSHSGWGSGIRDTWATSGHHAPPAPVVTYKPSGLLSEPWGTLAPVATDGKGAGEINAGIEAFREMESGR